MFTILKIVKLNPTKESGNAYIGCPDMAYKLAHTILAYMPDYYVLTVGETINSKPERSEEETKFVENALNLAYAILDNNEGN
jgi:hypothetical protein